MNRTLVCLIAGVTTASVLCACSRLWAAPPAADAAPTDAPKSAAAAVSPTHVPEGDEAKQFAKLIDTMLARPARELAQEGLRLGAEVLSELDHGSELARLEQRESFLERRLATLRRTLTERQAGLKKLKDDLTTKSAEIDERYDDVQVRAKLLRLLIDDIKPQLLAMKAEVASIEEETKLIAVRLGELRVELAERKFAREHISTSTASSVPAGRQSRAPSLAEIEKHFPVKSPVNSAQGKSEPSSKTNATAKPTTKPVDPKPAAQELKSLLDL